MGGGWKERGGGMWEWMGLAKLTVLLLSSQEMYLHEIQEGQ